MRVSDLRRCIQGLPDDMPVVVVKTPIRPEYETANAKVEYLNCKNGVWSPDGKGEKQPALIVD